METKTTSQRFASVPLASIMPSNYQRTTNHAQVRSIVKNFDEAKLGTLTLSQREGNLYCVDGQHRLSALRALNYTHAICEILAGLSREDEAEYFRTQGKDKRALKPHDLLRAGIVAGDEKCLRINDIVDENGFCIGYSSKDFWQIVAVNTLFTIVDDYGFDVLDDALFIVANTWDGIARASRGDCLLGVAEFVHRYGMAETLTRLHGYFHGVWHEYRQRVRQAGYGATARVIFCRVLVDFYNQGLPENSRLRLNWEG